jgi:hypothetical protein
MLTHQIQRINTTGMMVINHQAQYFPTLFQDHAVEANNPDKRFYFDKILADVPCTGDGAIRKLPKKWRNWSAKDGMSIHNLQLQILMRAMQLVKVGGLVLYSTCSLNPIENEAVVTELFRKANAGSFELVNLNEKLPELIKRPGLNRWPVMEEKEGYKTWKKNSNAGPNANTMQIEQQKEEDLFNIYESFSQLPVPYEGAIKATMFPDNFDTMKNIYKLHHTFRILPHDQNTGGFYLALIRKKAHVTYHKEGQQTQAQQIPTNPSNIVEEVKETEEELKAIQEIQVNVDAIVADEDNDDDKEEVKEEVKEEIKEEETKNQLTIPKAPQEKVPGKNSRAPKPKKTTYVQFHDAKYWSWIKEYYGVNEEILKPLLVWQNEGDKRILLVTPGIKKVLDCDTKGNVNKINMGAKILEKNKDSLMENACPYRICQDGISTAFNAITKRKLKVTAKDFTFFLDKPSYRYDEVPNPELRKELLAIGQGAILLYCSNDGNMKELDMLACLNFKASISVMASKELIESFKIRYLHE